MASYDEALEVKAQIDQLVKGDRNIQTVGIQNLAGKFGVLVGATYPKDVELPDNMLGVPIWVVPQDLTTPGEYQIRE